MSAQTHTLVELKGFLLQCGEIATKDGKTSFTFIFGDESGVSKVTCWDSAATKVGPSLLAADEKCETGCLSVVLNDIHVKCVGDKKPVVKLQSSPRSAIGKPGEVLIDPATQMVMDFAVLEYSKPQFVTHLRGKVVEVGGFGSASSSGSLLWRIPTCFCLFCTTAFSIPLPFHCHMFAPFRVFLVPVLSVRYVGHFCTHASSSCAKNASNNIFDDRPTSVFLLRSCASKAAEQQSSLVCWQGC